jgi:fatty-acyl-CoA synthase
MQKPLIRWNNWFRLSNQDALNRVNNFTHRLHQTWQANPDQSILHLLHNKLPDHSLTMNDLVRGALAYTRRLADAKIQPGEVVILILQHGEDLLFAFWGAILHGAIPSIMPFLTEKLSPDHYRSSLTSLFQVTAPAAVITYQEFVHEVELAVKDNSSVRCVIVSNQVEHVEEVIFEGVGGLDCQPDDIVLLQHSSGTTGLQKGVALSHQAVFNQLESYRKALQLNRHDVIVSWLPLYHDMGLIAGFILPILCAIPLVLISPFDWVRAPHRMFQAVSNYKGTLTWLPNFAYNFCAQKVRQREMENVDLSSWRAVINCSEPMYLSSHQAFTRRFQPYGLRESALATCYAMAENVFAVSQGGIGSPISIDRINQNAYFSERVARPAKDGEASIAMVSAGRPIQNTRLCILGEDRQELPERTIGEIAILSDCMLKEYYHRPDVTQQSFHQGWYLTGDLGFLADGEVFITGRKKDLIIVGGKNIYPQDLEYLASEVNGVHAGRVAAFGIFNPDAGTEEVVIVAELDELSLDEETILAISDEIRQKVNQGSDIALRVVKLVDRGWLLKTSSGKVARSANRDKYLAEFFSQDA